ncbi:hypothetical protein BASA81_003632 [Batrachochytrium salamandrivorans]|nr:hypothetical protein BASA81_003632 [Batrachochytrium salamandrivorans]
MPILWKRLAFQFDLDRGNTKTLRARFGLRKETESAKSSANEGKSGSKKKVNNSSVLLATPRLVRGGGGDKGKGSEFEQAFPPISLAHEPTEEVTTVVVEPVRKGKAHTATLILAPEFLALYEDCARYELETQPAKLNELGHRIVLTYILDNGPQSVDMESSLRKQVLELDNKHKFLPDSLLEVKAMALEMMQTNFYAQFLTRIEAEEE